jgi:predicted amidohydrolase
LVRQGAKIIIIPTFWTGSDCSAEGLRRNPDSETLFLESALTTRAFENTCCVIFVNAGGNEEGGPVGLSQVAMPFLGKMKGSFEGKEEGMKVVEVDMEILEEAEMNYKVREDMGRGNWHYGYSHA